MYNACVCQAKTVVKTKKVTVIYCTLISLNRVLNTLFYATKMHIYLINDQSIYIHVFHLNPIPRTRRNASINGVSYFDTLNVFLKQSYCNWIKFIFNINITIACIIPLCVQNKFSLSLL